MNVYLRILESLCSLLILAAITSACSSQTAEPPPGKVESTSPSRLTPPAVVETSQPGETQASPTPLPSQGNTPITGEVPDALMQAIMADLAARTGADPSSIEVVRAESVTWSDGSLGCPEPGMMYTQALVNGYWVVLKVNELEYDYRAGRGGSYRLCEGKGSGPIVGPSGEPVESPDR